jgi:uncharacterized protein (TIGR02145 family)
MKNVSLFLIAFVLNSMMLGSCGGSAPKEKSSPKEKGATKKVTIGKQVWMAENLNVDTFLNGEPIPEAKKAEEWKNAGENKQPAWCYYDNDLANGDKFGKLYNWYAVADARGLCPAGWHVPSDDEWTVVINALGGASIAGNKMKSISGWKLNGNGTNSSGFSGLPGGYRHVKGEFLFIGESGPLWSSTEYDTYLAWSSGLYYHNGSPSLMSTINKRSGFSVRCLRD